ncbi:unnamed protein product [Eretmochelys imbricata]
MRPPARGLASSFPLPRQPVPPLAQTLERYLRSLEVLVTPEELEENPAAGAGVRGARRGGGAAAGPAGAQSRPHGELALGLVGAERVSGEPLTPSPSTPARPSCSPNRTTATGGGSSGLQRSSSQGCWISRLRLISRLCWWSTGGGHPQCMAQYSRLFASCRLPGPKHDGLLLPPPGRRAPTFITVVRNFQFFQLEVYNSDGTPLTVDPAAPAAAACPGAVRGRRTRSRWGC